MHASKVQHTELSEHNSIGELLCATPLHIVSFARSNLEALPRLARDAAVGVIVPAWWGRE
jgi:hypothetical protein